MKKEEETLLWLVFRATERSKTPEAAASSGQARKLADMAPVFKNEPLNMWLT